VTDFLIDADCPRVLATLLREAGHNAEHVRDIGMGTAADEAIRAYAYRTRRIVISRDLDWSDVRSYEIGEHPGFVVIRVPPTFRADQIAEIFRSFLQSIALEELPGALTIIEPGRFRIRRL